MHYDGEYAHWDILLGCNNFLHRLLGASATINNWKGDLAYPIRKLGKDAQLDGASRQ